MCNSSICINRLRSHSFGFSLIEMMVVVLIMGVLLAVGGPSLNVYMTNNKIQATAQSFVSGLQQARGEAVRRNGNVNFILTDGAIDVATSTPDAAGKNWMVTAPVLDAPTTIEIINSKSANEGSANKVTIGGGVASVTFNSLGGTNLGAAAQYTFGFDGLTCGTATRCLSVVVTPGGRTQLCDPAVPATALGDSRRCIMS